MHLTLHATTRSAQRGVPLEIVKAIYWYGHEQRAPGYATRVTLDLNAIHLAAADASELCRKLERYQGTYLVLTDDQRIITVAHHGARLFH
ncbi:hypothetical protein [Ensifer sp. LCM 4579]|uniref:hypothetical protein n=1 Tax=Ensifer sp. LCM 4579 TaxID=1848292 RepID=UPI001041DDB3|nr:hypothetical protein [Ensifer sp. LCM 4579]